MDAFRSLTEGDRKTRSVLILFRLRNQGRDWTMRAIDILQEKLEPLLGFMHSKRRAALWRMVGGLLNGQQLWLTELGRNLPGPSSIKHRVKAVDRFMGSSAIQSAVSRLYGALATLLLCSKERPVLLVDWTGVGPGLCLLSAKIAFAGRALTILSRTYPEKKKANPDAERAFLEELKTIVPPRCRPVLVTDAGFLFKWVDCVRACGWDYVGRARFKNMIVYVEGRCMRLHQAYKLAKRKPRNLGTIYLGSNNPRAHRAVLSARPRRKGRRSLNRKGVPRASGVALTAQAAAREPLLLITSLADPARIVVDIYLMRMQIEETFRDLKSHRYGWSIRHIRTAHPRRADVMLLIAAIAAVAMHLVGITVRGSQLARGLQVNTERRRSVFSTFFLGRLTLNQNLEALLAPRSLRFALSKLIATLACVEQIKR
jgi:hypothetical protein